MLEEIGEEGGAGRVIVAADFGDLGQGDQQLLDPAELAILGGGDHAGDLEGLLTGPGGDHEAVLPAGVDGEPQGRDDRQPDQQEEPGTQACPDAYSHGPHSPLARVPADREDDSCATALTQDHRQTGLQ